MSFVLEELLADLAAMRSPVQADRALARALAGSCLLGPAQLVLDRLRGDAGDARDVEHLDGGWWRVDDGLERITEAAGTQAPRARLHLAGLAGAHPLWVDPQVPLPPALLRIAWEAATTHGPLAIARPGRLQIGAYTFGLGPGDGGRTLHDVDLVGAGPPVVGTAVEVGWGEPDEVLAHELAHALGFASEAEAERLGGLLARAAARLAMTRDAGRVGRRIGLPAATGPSPSRR